MLHQFKKHIEINFPFLKEAKLLIAISGGIDSVVLSELLHQLHFDISLAHCNFQLRGKESNNDEIFTKEFAKQLNVNIFTIKFNTNTFSKENKQSIQVTARNLRYVWFQELIKEHHFNYVLTAHQADDNLETFLINISRGTGLEGLTGIPAINKNIIRPLLPFSRDEIMTFAKENAISWREDQSNQETKYLRNKIRHQITPVLKEINPNLVDSFQKTTLYLQESHQIINDRIEDIRSKILTKEKEVVQLSIAAIQKLSNPKAYLYWLLKDYGFSEWEDVTNLLKAQSGKKVFSKTHQLLKDRDFLLLTKKRNTSKKRASFLIPKNTLEITTPIPLKLEQISEKATLQKESIYVNESLLKFPLIIRKWEHGDYFYPLGMQGKKKLSKYFKDEKISLLEKENIWLLCSAENEIIWIIKHRQDKRFASKDAATNNLKISIHE